MSRSSNCGRSLTSGRCLLAFSAIATFTIVAACGPTAIGVALGSGSSKGTAPLAIESTEVTADVGTRPCSLLAKLELRVNRRNATLTYSLDNGPFVPFVDPRTGIATGELSPFLTEARYVLVRAGVNTVVIRASVGDEVVTKTVTITRLVDPQIVDLEPIDVRGQAMQLTWTLPTGDETFFWIHYDDAPASGIDGLVGTAGNGASPVRVPVDQLQRTVEGARTRYTYLVNSLATAANGLLQHHYFAVRANDGCESRIVAAHTRPAEVVPSWPGVLREQRDLVTPASATTPNENALAPVGGVASSSTVVGMPPLLMDRGADTTNLTLGGISVADGLDDMVLTDRAGTTFVARNNSGVLESPIAVDDVTGPSPPCGLANGPAGAILRSFQFENDDDQRSDLFVLSAQRLTPYASDDATEGLTSRPTLGSSEQYLNFKKICSGILGLGNVPGLPANHQFLDAFHGDFDGDGTQDLVVSTGLPPTSAQPGATSFLCVFYGNSDPANGFTLWDWPTRPPQVLAVNTAFGDDGYFVVGDVDRDGRDDLVTLRHLGADEARYHVLLMRGRTTTPVTLQSGIIDPRTENARWDQTALADIDHDGVLDVLGLHTKPLGGAWIVELLGYRTNLAGGTIVTAPPFVQYDLVRTHLTLTTGQRQRGHLQVTDIDGDGTADILVRSIIGASEYTTSKITLLTGQRDLTTGRQNWQAFDPSPTSIDLQLAGNEIPHVHFAMSDLDFDGVQDLCAIHERSQPPHAAVVMHSNTTWQYERFTTAPGSEAYAFGGTVATGGGATTVRAANVLRHGDLVLAVDAVAGVKVLPAATDQGRVNGAFRAARQVPLLTPLPAPVLQFRVPEEPGTDGGLVVLCSNGQVGSLTYDANADAYAWLAGPIVPGATTLAAARFDTDRRLDAVVVDGNNVMHLLASVDANGVHAGPLGVRATQQLPRAAEFVVATNVANDLFGEVVVVLAPEAGQTTRVTNVWRVLRTDETGVPRFAAPVFVTSFPARVVSLVASNLTGRYRNNLDRRKWLIAGTNDGRVLAARSNQAVAEPLSGVPDAPGGEVQLLVADFTNDNIPDLVGNVRGSRQLFLFRNQPDASQPWRFPLPGSYQFQGTGLFDSPVVISLPEAVGDLAAARVDNDVLQDVLALSADGQRVHVVLTRGSQQGF